MQTTENTLYPRKDPAHICFKIQAIGLVSTMSLRTQESKYAGYIVHSGAVIKGPNRVLLTHVTCALTPPIMYHVCSFEQNFTGKP